MERQEKSVFVNNAFPCGPFLRGTFHKSVYRFKAIEGSHLTFIPNIIFPNIISIVMSECGYECQNKQNPA
jgi:hypothetical protein